MKWVNHKNVDPVPWMKVYELVSSDFNIKFGPLAMTACEQWNEAYDLLTESPLFRHKVKKTANTVCDRWKRHWSLTSRAFGEKYPLYLDFCNRCYAEKLESDCTKLFFAIKNRFDNMGFTDTPLKVRVVMAKELAHMAKALFHNFWKACLDKYGYEEPGQLFLFIEPTPVVTPQEELCDLLFSGCDYLGKEKVDLGDDMHCNNGFIAITNRIMNTDWLDEMGVDAMRMNCDGNEHMRETIEMHDRMKAEEKEIKERERRARERKKEEPPLDLGRLSEKYKVTSLR